MAPLRDGKMSWVSDVDVGHIDATVLFDAVDFDTLDLNGGTLPIRFALYINTYSSSGSWFRNDLEY